MRDKLKSTHFGMLLESAWRMVKTQAISTGAERAPMQAYIVLLIGLISASAAAIFIRLSQGEGVPSLLIASGRLIVATLILTPAVLRQQKYVQQIRDLTRQQILLIGGSGVFLAIHFAAWVSSLEYTTVLISVVLVTTTPIWVALMEVFFLRARLSQMVVAGLILGLVGGVIIGFSGIGETADGSGNDQLFGALLSLIGSLGVAGYLIIGRKVRSTLSLTPYIWLVYGTAALILMAVIAVSGTQVTGYSAAGYGWILAMGIFAQLIGHSSFNYALAYVSATYISVATQLEAVLSSIYAYFIFNELPSLGQIVGGMVIMVGVFLASLGQANQTRRKQESD